MGDFNINLLNYESHSDTNEFLNNIISHYLLPYTLHSTRVTDHSATVIDNIFSDNTDHDTYNGNILTNISLTVSKRDFSNFNENSLISDFSKLDNSFLNDPNINFKL